MTVALRSAALGLLLSPLAWGFITPPSSSFGLKNGIAASPLPVRSTRDDDDDTTSAAMTNALSHNGYEVSARTARLVVPSLLVLGGKSLPANAGIGTPIVFEEARKEKFGGSLRNSVIALRVSSSLSKRGYSPGSCNVGVFQKSDLGETLSKIFSNGHVYDLNNESSDFIDACQNKRALILFGPEVTISSEGDIGDVTGNMSGEDVIRTKLVGKMPEITFLGGLVIHTPKGGKDRAEDYFQPLMLNTIYVRQNSEADLYERAFGDLPTPRRK